MRNPEKTSEQTLFTRKIIETVIRLTILVLLIGWCFAIIEPFFIIIAWGLILAIAMHPLYTFFQKKAKVNSKWAAIFVTIILLSFILVPTAFLTKSMVTNIGIMKELIKDGKEIIPPPSPQVSEWPVIGKFTYDFWLDASNHLDVVIKENATQIKTISFWLLDNLGGAGSGFLKFVLSIFVSGIMLAYSKEGRKAADTIGVRLIGERGKEFIKDVITTVRNVARGILGVAFFQAILFGLGLAVAGVPFVGIWSIICLILAIIQLGLGPIIIPISIYMFMTGDVLTAILLTIWMVLISLIDNIVKPLVMGRNAPVPTLVIFLGAIGGFMLNGIIGLFIGAVVLSLGYKIYQWWLNYENLSPIDNE